ncbi:MAG TPA: carboxypeptidase regulatory-like domain-containing protein [Thermoanaerobaculia bacterium]|jgi:hypothetical protein
MTLEQPRRLHFVVLALALALALPGLAAKRRSVAVGGAPKFYVPTLTGTVLDSVTGAPVAFVEVHANDGLGITDAQGKFRIDGITGYGVINVEALRSGYTSQTLKITTAGDQNLVFHLAPTPTATLRLTNGTTEQIDYESIEFGYPVPFSGYRSAEYDDFCTSAGEKTRINKLAMRRITGPAAKGSSGCCAQITKVTVELKSGQSDALGFVDSCDGYRVDFIGRDHVTGKFVYIPFEQVSEVVFP